MAVPASKNVRTAGYREMQGRLPGRIVRLAGLAFAKFCEDPAHPSLRLHALDDDGRGRHRGGSLSVAINLQYRAIFAVDGDANVWYWVGTHNDYDAFKGRRD